jgi:hypothetical protein
MKPQPLCAALLVKASEMARVAGSAGQVARAKVLLKRQPKPLSAGATREFWEAERSGFDDRQQQLAAAAGLKVLRL